MTFLNVCAIMILAIMVLVGWIIFLMKKIEKLESDFKSLRYQTNDVLDWHKQRIDKVSKIIEETLDTSKEK